MTTLLGTTPVVLIPRSGKAHVNDQTPMEGSILTHSILLWLACATAGGSAVAVLEIGAVALALKFGYAPTLAILFTLPLCRASVAGGIWVSIRNRVASRKAVVAYLATMTFGIALAAFGTSLATTVIATIFVGLVLAPLGTFYSLILHSPSATLRTPLAALLAVRAYLHRKT